MRTLLLTWLALSLHRGHYSEPNTAADESKVEFQIVNAGILVTGTLDEVTADNRFDETKLDKCSIIAKANSKTISTGIVIRDKHLQRKDYFHSERFPEIELVSISFKKVGRNKFTGKFRLTIKSITRDVIIPITVSKDGNTRLYAGKLMFNRLDFDLGEESALLNNNVTVLMKARTSS